MYTCRLWSSTGFDAINIPDGVATFNALPYTDFPALDILQSRGLSSVTIRATDADVRNADYMCLFSQATGDDTRATYYSITGYVMEAKDSARLFVIEDYITSLGGVSQLALVGGIVKRFTVPYGESFGEYTESDPLLSCAEPLKLFSEWMYTSGQGGAKTDLTFLESSVNVMAMSADPPPSKTFEDAQTGASVVVPIAEALPSIAKTDYKIIISAEQPDPQTIIEVAEEVKNPSGCVIYLMNSSDATITQALKKGLENLRSISADTAIISQYCVPSYFCAYTMAQAGSFVGELKSNGDTALPKTPQSADFNFIFSGNYSPVNMRLRYGSNCRFGIITCAGVRGEFLPEDIYKSGEAKPRIQCIADPRPGGAPYFRFKDYLGNSTEFWRDALRGATWCDVPLRYTGQRGSSDVQIAYDLSVMGQNTAYIQADGLWGQDFNYLYNPENGYFGMDRAGLIGLGGAIGLSGNPIQQIGAYGANGAVSNGEMIGAGIGIGLTSAARGTLGAIGAGEAVAYQQYHVQQEHALDLSRRLALRRNELYAMGVQTVTRAPQIAFMASADAIRDIHSNGILVYRYKPSDNDLERLDRILTLYGYKVNIPVGDTKLGNLFYNRPVFDYVEIAGASVTSQIGSKAEREGARDQLSAGVRVWHGVKPRNVSPSENAAVQPT